MYRTEWEKLDDYGKSIYVYMLECDRFKSRHGSYPSQEEIPRPVPGSAFTGQAPPFEVRSHHANLAISARTKNNPTPGVTLTRCKKKGHKTTEVWKATVYCSKTGKKFSKRAKTRYLACVARNSMVTQCYGEERPDLLIDLSKVEE